MVIFLGFSAPGLVTTEMVKTMNRDAIIFACANPTPEIFPDDAKAGGAKVISTGRSNYPNQINNVLAFPGIFRGTFDVRASEINEEMKLAAAVLFCCKFGTFCALASSNYYGVGIGGNEKVWKNGKELAKNLERW